MVAREESSMVEKEDSNMVKKEEISMAEVNTMVEESNMIKVMKEKENKVIKVRVILKNLRDL